MCDALHFISAHGIRQVQSAQPSSVIFDAHTPQLPHKSGPIAGDDGLQTLAKQ